MTEETKHKRAQEKLLFIEKQISFLKEIRDSIKLSCKDCIKTCCSAGKDEKADPHCFEIKEI